MRLDLFLPDATVHVADALVDDRARRIDQKTLRRAVHAEVDAERALRVDDVEFVRIAQLRKPQARLRRVVLVVHADDPQAALVVNAQQFGVFRAARRAPGRPDVDQHRTAHVRCVKRDRCRPGAPSAGRSKSGNGLPISADGSRCGSFRLNPAYSSATITTNAVSGMNRLARLKRPPPSSAGSIASRRSHAPGSAAAATPTSRRTRNRR